MTFKYAFNTWVYGSFPAWLPCYPLEEVITRLAAIGYDGIEIGCAAPHAFPAHLSKAHRADLASLMQDKGLACVSLLPAPGGGMGNNPASFLPEERAMTVAHYKEVIDLAADLGAGRVLYVAGWRGFGVSHAEALDWTAAALTQIAHHAADKGIEVCIEPTSADSNLIDTAGHALALKKAVGLPNVGIMFDTYHSAYRNETAQDYVAELERDLTHIHLSDTDRMPPGCGKLDWHGILSSLKAASFDGYLTMEIGFPYRSADADWFARTALQNLKAVESAL